MDSADLDSAGFDSAGFSAACLLLSPLEVDELVVLFPLAPDAEPPLALFEALVPALVPDAPPALGAPNPPEALLVEVTPLAKLDAGEALATDGTEVPPKVPSVPPMV